jgi:hypothetical protein
MPRCRQKAWRKTVGAYGHTVIVEERSPGSVLYLRWCDASATGKRTNGKTGNWRWRSLGHRDMELGEEQAKELAGRLLTSQEATATSRITLGDLLARYEAEVSAHKKGSQPREDHAVSTSGRKFSERTAIRRRSPRRPSATRRCFPRLRVGRVGGPRPGVDGMRATCTSARNERPVTATRARSARRTSATSSGNARTGSAGTSIGCPATPPRSCSASMRTGGSGRPKGSTCRRRMWPRPEAGWTRAAWRNATSRRTRRRSSRSSPNPGSCAKPYHKPYQPPPESSGPTTETVAGPSLPAIGTAGFEPATP